MTARKRGVISSIAPICPDLGLGLGPIEQRAYVPIAPIIPPYNTTNLALRDTSGPLVVVDRDDVKLITLR